MRFLGFVLKLPFIAIGVILAALMGTLRLMANNSTYTETGRRKIARRESDELRKLRLKQARRRESREM